MDNVKVDNWFLSINDQVENVKKYEDVVDRYYTNNLSDKEIVYSTPIMTAFYIKDKFNSHISNILVKYMKISVILLLITSLISWLFLVIRDDNPILAAIKQSGSKYLIIAISIGLLSVCSILGCIILFKYLNNLILVKQLIKYENTLKSMIETIPNNYRSYDKIKTLLQIYFTGKTSDFNIMLSVCDDFTSENRTRPISNIMFDIPYKNDFVSMDKTKSNVIVQETVHNTEENEFLPSDINSKIYSGSENSEKDLSEMVGLDSVKNQITKLKNRIEFYGKTENNGNHMSFLGGAGTGKTSVARIITKILFDLGYIKKNQYIEISGDYLRSGDSARSLAIIEKSFGGVLFIDEAYLLYNTNSQSNDAIGILLKAMEDHRQDFVVILAGYEEQMTKLFSSNEGFTSRVKHNIYFPDYTIDEMYNIFTVFISSYNGKKYVLNEEAKQLLLDTFKIEKTSKTFGNARTVRNAVDNILDYYVDRSISTNNKSNIIELVDVESYTKDRKLMLQHELKNSSAANHLDESIIRLADVKSKVKYGSENPDEDLSKLIGLESFKNEITVLQSQKDFYSDVNQQKILLLGADGCGKSSLTKVLTGYLYKMGYIQENKYLDITAEFLKGSYVGHTNKRAESIISYASGGVLFIRDINKLLDNSDSFSQEALSAITQSLTANNDNITIIIADNSSNYLNNLKNLFDIVYTFPTYTSENLYNIFMLNMSLDNFVMNAEAMTKVSNHILNNPTLKIRDILNLYDNTKKKHISNYDGNIEHKFTICANDIAINNKIKLNISK